MFKRDDWMFGLLAIGVGVVALVATAGLVGIKTMDPAGPAAFPKIISWMMIGIGVMHVIGSYLVIRKGGEVKKKKEKNNVPVFLICVAGLVYYLLLGTVGYPILTPLLIAAVMMSVGERRQRRVWPTAIGSSLFLFVAFHYGLGVPMPLGFLEPLFG